MSPQAGESSPAQKVIQKASSILAYFDLMMKNKARRKVSINVRQLIDLILLLGPRG